MTKLYILERRILQCIVHNRERKRAKVRKLALGKMEIAPIHEYSRLTWPFPSTTMRVPRPIRPRSAVHSSQLSSLYAASHRECRSSVLSPSRLTRIPALPFGTRSATEKLAPRDCSRARAFIVLVSLHAANASKEREAEAGFDAADAREVPQRAWSDCPRLAISARPRQMELFFFPPFRNEEISGVSRLERASGTEWLSRLDTPRDPSWVSLSTVKSWTRDSTVMVHGVVWWFSGGGNWRFDNACYVTHEGRWVSSYDHLFLYCTTLFIRRHTCAISRGARGYLDVTFED